MHYIVLKQNCLYSNLMIHLNTASNSKTDYIFFIFYNYMFIFIIITFILYNFYIYNNPIKTSNTFFMNTLTSLSILSFY